MTELVEPPDSSPKLSRKVQVSFWTSDQEKTYPPSKMLFTKDSVAIIWGMQPRAVQVMFLP